MERAPLRPVPSRPPSPVDPAEAIRHVAGELSTLDAPAAEALALVALAGRSRDELAGERGLSSEELAEALARARKALRRRLHPLPGSGWCERAERLISDRIDDALRDPGPARLAVHLANCSRCVEHDRRLIQAHDALVAGFVESVAPTPEAQPQADAAPQPPEEPASAPAAPLRIVDAAAKASGPAPRSESAPEPDEAAAPPETAEPPALEADAPTALPPADESLALPEPEDPPALPDPGDAPALPDAEDPATIAETEDAPALPDVGEPPAMPEADEVIVAPEGAKADDADAQPTSGEAGSLAEVVPIPTAPRTPRPAPSPVSRPPLDRGQPPARPATPSRAPVQPLRRPSPPNPRWERLAATYPPLRTPDSSRPPASEDTLAAVVPLLVIAALGIFVLAFAVLTVGF